MEYRQINYEDRIRIQALFSAGNTFDQIGKYIGKDSTTISREIKRNSVHKIYDAKIAQKLYCVRKALNAKRKLDDPKLRFLVRDLLVLLWSPEQISGRLRLFRVYISHETIYKWIYSQLKIGINYLQYLRINKKRNKRGSKYKKRNIIEGKKSIHDRPLAVQIKKRFGDWEGDTLEGKRNSGFIATFVERKSLLLVAAKMNNKNAETFNKAAALAFSAIENIKTLTVDNGSEMSQFRNLEKVLNCNVYFADPGNPGQRGLNENTNGILRQFFPKGADFAKLNQEHIQKAMYNLNNRPRKLLGFKSPLETYLKRKPLEIIPALRL